MRPHQTKYLVRILNYSGIAVNAHVKQASISIKTVISPHHSWSRCNLLTVEELQRRMIELKVHGLGILSSYPSVGE